MKFLQDESADFPLAVVLSDLGHDVKAIVTDYPRSIADEEVLAIAAREERILITNDRDFGELIFRQHRQHAGVILFRLGSEPIEEKAAWLAQILNHYPEQLSNFIVVAENGVRIRRV